MIFLVNQKTNWDFPAKKKILDHYKKPRINLKRTIAVLGKLGFTLTMWDVKTLAPEKGRFLVIVLP